MDNKNHTQSKKNWLICISVALFYSICTFAIYSHTLNAPFYFDGIKRIKDNPYVRVSELSVEQLLKSVFNPFSLATRPVSNISIALNYYFHQYNLPGYHIINIIIHFFTGFLLFVLIKNLLKRNKNLNGDQSVSGYGNDLTLTAFFSALIWLSHPLHTSSVTYIIQRMNSMAGMFFLVALICYMKGRIVTTSKSFKKILKVRIDYFWYAGGFSAWLLSLGCKETTAVLLIIVLLLEFYFFQDLNKEWITRNLKYLIPISIAFFIVAVIYLGADPIGKLSSLSDFSKNTFTFKERVITQTRVVIYYITLILYPHPLRLNLDYNYPLSHALTDPLMTLAALFAIITLLFFSFYTAKKNRLLSFCILWYFINLSVESSIIPLAIIFEHRTYLPSMLIPVCIILPFKDKIRRKKLLITTLIGIGICFSIWTYERNQIWNNKLTFWKDCIKKSPNKERPYINLVKALILDNQLNNAMHYLTIALDINPNSKEGLLNMGAISQKLGKRDKALNYFTKAIEIDPNEAKAHNNIGTIYKDLGKFDDALQHYNRAITLNPFLPETYYNRGVLFEIKGKSQKALADFNQAVQLKPDLAKLRLKLGNALIKKGKLNEAIFHFKTAVAINPHDVKAHLLLAKALTKSDKTKESIEVYKKILKLNPQLSTIYYNIACLYAKKYNVEEAIVWLKMAIHKGYDKWDLIKTDPDLNPIRHTNDYQRLIGTKK